MASSNASPSRLTWFLPIANVVFLLATANTPPASNVAAAMRLKFDEDWEAEALLFCFNKGASSALETVPYTFIFSFEMMRLIRERL